MVLNVGIIDDIDNTIAVLVEGSFLPLSVIIIGVGKAVFANMDVLDIYDDYLFTILGFFIKRLILYFF